MNNPIHLHRVGLFNNNTDLYETNMNFLMTMALQKVAYAPFAFLVDKVNTPQSHIKMQLYPKLTLNLSLLRMKCATL